MKLYDMNLQLEYLIENVDAVFIRTTPEVPDFTSNSNFILSIFTQKQKLDIEITPNNIRDVVTLLNVKLFSKEYIKRIYTWNIKALATYFKHFTSDFMSPTTSILDLKIIENFLGIQKNRPENLTEAINRVKIAVKYKGWQTLYKSIHLPLALNVLPSIETTPLLNELTRLEEYPCYDIEGQNNGRMNCSKKFAYSYLPHTMGPEVKAALKPLGYNIRFIAADFRHCEVTVLEWLTGDERLKEILDSGQDLHKKIYEIITDDSCDTDKKRSISKIMFLPVMYGLSAKGLSKNLGLSKNVGSELHNRIRTNFSTAFNRMIEIQKQAEKGPVEDYFGRIRQFSENETYKARNFWVQGVAATLCQEKLIDLHEILDSEEAYLVYSVHDGYCMCSKTKSTPEVYRTVKQTLEAESKLCHGLKMKVEIKIGTRLDNMKVF